MDYRMVNREFILQYVELYLVDIAAGLVTLPVRPYIPEGLSNGCPCGNAMFEAIIFFSKDGPRSQDDKKRSKQHK